jgi:hypothetical protein
MKAARGRAPIHAENARQVCRFAMHRSMLDARRVDENGVRLTRSARDCTCPEMAARSAFMGSWPHLAALFYGSAEMSSVSDGRVTHP